MKGSHLGEFEELILLAVGQLGDNAHSVAIQAALLRQAGRSAGLGAIYAALDRLQRKQMVDSWLASPESKRGGRRKRHYSLTETGRASLDETRRVREQMWRAVRRSEARS